MLLCVSLFMFFDQIVEYRKGMFSIHLARHTDHRPATEKAENQVTQPRQGQNERHWLARQPVTEHAVRVERGDETHQAAERKGDQPQGEAIAITAKPLREGCQKPRYQCADDSSDQDQQREFEVNDSHVL